MTEELKKRMQWRDTFQHNLLISGILVLIGLILPAIISVESFKIYDSLYLSLDTQDQGLLIITAFKLVMMNSVRILPVYMASYNLIEYARPKGDHLKEWVVYVLGLALIPIFYQVVYLIYHFRYDFGMPSIIIMISILLFTIKDLSHINIIKKSMFVILLLISLQWLDVIPLLSSYGFGGGDVSVDLKMFSELLGANSALSFSGISFFIIFLINALMIFKFLKDQDTVIKTLNHQKLMEKELNELNIKNLRARTSEEMEHLVHDLKSPLTSIQALVSFSEMLLEDKKIISYMGRINESVDQLNEMISEILHENRKHSTSLKDIFESVLSQISPVIGSDTIHLNNQCAETLLEVNKIRFTRMIINIINNSLSATKHMNGQITINVIDDGDDVQITIRDNGVGIATDHLDKIKDKGFSTKGSSGLGLQYVEKVIHNHGGVMMIESVINIGTTTTIVIPKGEAEYEKHFDN